MSLERQLLQQDTRETPSTMLWELLHYEGCQLNTRAHARIHTHTRDRTFSIFHTSSSKNTSIVTRPCIYKETSKWPQHNTIAAEGLMSIAAMALILSFSICTNSQTYGLKLRTHAHTHTHIPMPDRGQFSSQLSIQIQKLKHLPQYMREKES